MHTRIINRCHQAVVLTFLTLIGSTSTTLADSGDLDPAFGVGGIVTTDITPDNDRAQGAVLLADGSILLAGNGMNGNVLTLVKYRSDGTLDFTFGVNGKVSGPAGSGEAIAVQDDGKILVAGYAPSSTTNDFLVARFNPNGTLDPSFSGDGVVITDVGGFEDQARAIAIQTDGKIVVGGHAKVNGSVDFAALRYNEDGSLDNTFSGDGKVTTSVTLGSDHAYGIAMQPDGKILLAGWGGTLNDGGVELVRYEANGSLDTDFGSNGIVFLDEISNCRSVCIQADGKILVAGGARVGPGGTYDFAVARFDVNGDLDPAFSADGMVFTRLDFEGIGNCIALGAGGKILVAGSSSGGIALVRYDQHGALDSEFSSDGKICTVAEGSSDTASSLAVQPNGMVVVAGYTEKDGGAFFRVVRYEGRDTDRDGLNDSVETNTGTYLTPFQTGTNPFDPDSDDDGLMDGIEVSKYGSSPLNKDSDSDGFDDGFEVSTGFDPISNSSVPLTTSIMLTAVEFRFFAPAGKILKIEASTDLQSWYSIENDIAGIGTTHTRYYSIQTIPKRYFRVTEQ